MLSDERLHHIAGEVVRSLWASDHIEEVYVDDDKIHKFVTDVFQHHLVVDERLREEAKSRLKNVEFGSMEWDVQYRRVMDELREREGLL